MKSAMKNSSFFYYNANIGKMFTEHDISSHLIVLILQSIFTKNNFFGVDD